MPAKSLIFAQTSRGPLVKNRHTIQPGLTNIRRTPTSEIADSILDGTAVPAIRLHSHTVPEDTAEPSDLLAEGDYIKPQSAFQS